jgi:hypothetical protein
MNKLIATEFTYTIRWHDGTTTTYTNGSYLGRKPATARTIRAAINSARTFARFKLLTVEIQRSYVSRWIAK